MSRLSGSGSFSGGLVFAGYGIDAPSVGYDDFAGLELRGKVALIVLGEPQEADADSPFDGLIPSRWSHPRAKAEPAAQRGAAAVVFVGNAEAKAFASEPEGPAMQPIAIPVTDLRQVPYERVPRRAATVRSTGASGNRFVLRWPRYSAPRSRA